MSEPKMRERAEAWLRGCSDATDAGGWERRHPASDVRVASLAALLEDVRQENPCHHGWRGRAAEPISTPCPACGLRSLFVGSGGHLTCASVPAGESSGCQSPGVESYVDGLEARIAELEKENAEMLAYGLRPEHAPAPSEAKRWSTGVYPEPCHKDGHGFCYACPICDRHMARVESERHICAPAPSEPERWTLRSRLAASEQARAAAEQLAFRLAEALEQYSPDFGGIMDEGLALRPSGDAPMEPKP